MTLYETNPIRIVFGSKDMEIIKGATKNKLVLIADPYSYYVPFRKGYQFSEYQRMWDFITSLFDFDCMILSTRPNKTLIKKCLSEELDILDLDKFLKNLIDYKRKNLSSEYQQFAVAITQRAWATQAYENRITSFIKRFYDNNLIDDYVMGEYDPYNKIKITPSDAREEKVRDALLVGALMSICYSAWSLPQWAKDTNAYWYITRGKGAEEKHCKPFLDKPLKV